MSTQTYHGGCHCGAVAYEAEIDLDQGTLRCNCSLCAKTRAWLVATSADQFRLTRGEDALTRYRWTPEGKPEPNITYHFCATCGVRTHAQGTGPGGAAMVMVQVASLEDADPEQLAGKITYVDGLHDRFDREPDNKDAL